MATRQVPELPVTTELNDSDLLHVRQGAVDRRATGLVSKQYHRGVLHYVGNETFPFKKDMLCIGSDGFLYRALRDGVVGVNPVTDNTLRWIALSGQMDGQVARIGDINVDGNTAVVVGSGQNSNGKYRLWSDGFKEQWGLNTAPPELGGFRTYSYPVPFVYEGAPEIVSITPKGASSPIVEVKDMTETTYEVGYSIPVSQSLYSQNPFYFYFAGR